jgi:hypothetical protein
MGSDGSASHNWRQPERRYMLCLCCDAKFFTQEPVEKCPRCMGTNLLATEAIPPWRETPSPSCKPMPQEVEPPENHQDSPW